MSELKLPRLLAAAKEFNIGQDTLIEFLVKKGFPKDDLKPTAKLSEDQYRALMAEFQGDKVAKNKADLVEIPKGSSGEAKKKKDEEEISFRKEEKKVVAPKEEAKSIEVPEAKPVEVEIPEVAPVIEQTPEPIAISAPAIEEKTTPVVETEKVKIETPEIEGPKVINKIDLSAIDSSTRPKKPVKKQEPPIAPKPFGV